MAAGKGSTPTGVRRAILLLAAVAAALAAFAPLASAQDTTGLPLPPGQIIPGPIFRSDATFVPSITVGADANTYLNIGPPTEPFTPATPAVVVRTTVATQYVRAFTAGVTNQAGGFIAGSNTVRGLTAAQIRDVLALPFLPDSLTIALVPVGTCMIVGEAAPILGNFPANPPNIPAPGPWGHGGITQERLLGASASPGCGSTFTSFIDAQPIGAAALSYRPRAGAGNAGAVARALDFAPPPALFSDMDGIYNSLDLLNIGDPAPLRSALIQLDGEAYADVPSVEIAAGHLFLNTLQSQMRVGRWQQELGLGDPPGDGAALSPTGTGILRQWVSGLGGTGGISGHGDSHDVDFGSGGVMGGAEYRFDPSLFAEVAGGYARSGFGTTGISGSGNLDLFFLGLYASKTSGPWYFDAALGYGHDDGDLSRTITFPGVSRTALGALSANDFLSSAEVGFHLPLAVPIVVTPFADLQAIVVDQYRSTETGAGAIDLHVAGRTAASARSILGAELSHELSVGLSAPVKVAARVGWAHDFADAHRAATMTFDGSPAAFFAVNGARVPRDSAVVGFGLDLPAAPVTLFIRYDGTFASGATSHSATAGLRLAF